MWTLKFIYSFIKFTIKYVFVADWFKEQIEYRWLSARLQ